MTSLPNGWAGVTLGDVVKLRGEKRQPSETPSALFVGLENVEPHTSRILKYEKAADMKSAAARFTPGDVLYSRLRPYLNKVFKAEVEGLASAEFLVLKSSHSIEPEYLRRRIMAVDFLDFTAGLDRGDRPRVDYEQISAFKLALPPFVEQGRIVAKLDSLMARTARARSELDHIPRLVEKYKQAILAKAFSGELTKEWRGPHARTDAIEFLRSLDVPTYQNHRGEPLPDGWHWVTAGSMCAIKGGVALGKSRTSDTELIELPYLRVANVQRGWLNLSEIKTVKVSLREADALYLKPGDVLMNEGGDRDKLGRGWVWDGQIKNCIHQNHVFRLRPKSSMIPSRYISYYSNAFGQRYFLDEGKQTTNLASISMSKISSLPIPVCAPAEMERIVQRIEAAFTWLDKVAAEHARASHLVPKLDQSILAKAFRGELVPQDPNDEPASVLLERIGGDKDNVASGKSKPVKGKVRS